MRIRDLVATAISNTFRSKLRTTLTVLAIFVGAFTLTLTNAVGAGVSQYVDAQVGALGSPDVFIITQASEANTAGDGPVKYDAATSALVASRQGPPGTTTKALTDADLTSIADITGIESVDPIRSVQPDYIEYDSGTAYEFSINATSAVTTADLTAGAQLDGSADEAQLVLPDTFVTPLGFAAADDAVGASVLIGITDILGAKHTVNATVVGVSLDSLLAAGAGANDALIAELADAQSGGTIPP
jgi:putative ABC transport system permease protein